MTCRADQRQRARRARDRLDACAAVADTSLVAPGEEPTDRWLVDVLVAAESRAVPPLVARRIGAQGLWTRSVAPRGEYYTVLATL